MATNRPTPPKQASMESLQTVNNQELAMKERTRMALAEAYKAEDEVQVSGSPMYRPYFGNNMPISINGIYISVPLDGRPYKIPRSFAEVFNTRIRSVDDDLTLQKRLANVQQNHENFAGELDLVREV